MVTSTSSSLPIPAGFEHFKALGQSLQKTFQGEWHNLNESFEDFTAAMERGDKVWLDREGNWSILDSVRLYPTYIPLFEEIRLQRIAEVFASQLDQLEKIPVSLSASTETNRKSCMEKHQKALTAIKQQLDVYITSKRVDEQFKILSQRWVAFQYRMEASSGGLNAKSARLEDIENLEKWAVKWKESYALYEDKTLLEQEKKKLHEAARYPEFVKLLDVDMKLREFFFRWALRDNNSVEAFVQFPSTCNRIKTAFLAGRIGYFAKNKPLKMITAEGQKDLTLPFQIQDEAGKLKTKRISILNEEREINFRGNFKLTVKEIFQMFSEKNDRVGRLELMGKKGICNWHTNELGWWNPEKNDYERVDLSEENSEWWKKLPGWEKIEKEKALERYGLSHVELGQWIVVIKSSRESTTLDINKSHGYTEILIPSEKDKNEYLVYPIGKFTKSFPFKPLEKLLFITDTVETRYQFPDDNPSHSHRQQAAAPFVVSEEEGRALMETVRVDFKMGLEGNVPFMFGQKNCAAWPQNKLEALYAKKSSISSENAEAKNSDLKGKSVESNDEIKETEACPNFFKAPLLEATPSFEPLKSLFAFGRYLDLPEEIKIMAVKVAAFLFGSWREMEVEENGEKVSYSMMNSGFSEKGEVYFPAMLHKRIQEKVIQGRVYFGHFFAEQKKSKLKPKEITITLEN